MPDRLFSVGKKSLAADQFFQSTVAAIPHVHPATLDRRVCMVSRLGKQRARHHSLFPAIRIVGRLKSRPEKPAVGALFIPAHIAAKVRRSGVRCPPWGLGCQVLISRFIGNWLSRRFPVAENAV